MDKYLLQILLETKTIIIPGLGALTITNEETGEIMFMSYLKYDDGALVKHIAEKENISENDAKNIIAKYVSEINAKLGQGHDYEMFQFGRFFLKDGEIEFENWRNTSAPDSIVPAADEKEEIPPVVVVETITETVVEINEIPIQEEVRHEEDKTLDEILEETKEVEDIPSEDVVEPIIISKENSYTPPVIDSQIEQEVEQEIEVPVEEEVVIPAETEPIIEFEKPVETKVVVVKKKRKPIFWVLIILIIILLAISSLTVLFYDQVKQYLPFMESQRTEVERNKANAEELSEEMNESAEAYENSAQGDVTSEDQVQTDEPTTVEPIQEVKSEEVITKPVAPVKEIALPKTNKTVASNGKQYHVIGGAFEDKANADRYAEKLRAAGNQTSVFGRYDGFYLVAIDSYDSESEANQAISKFSDITTKAWVFHKR